MAYIPQPPCPALTTLADPTRQAIVQKLAEGPLAVSELAGTFPISRPAISQHLKVLSDAGLVVAEPQGARRLYRLNPEGVAGLRAWIDALWDDALAAFQAEAAKLAKGKLS